MPEIIQLALEEDLQEVIQRLAETFDVPTNEAVAIALRDWAIGNGYLPPDEMDLDKDTPTQGNA